MGRPKSGFRPVNQVYIAHGPLRYAEVGEPAQGLGGTVRRILKGPSEVQVIIENDDGTRFMHTVDPVCWFCEGVCDV